MDIAMTLPTMITHDRSNTLDWCRAVDEGPWSSLAIPERITYPSHSWIVELSAAAALTERVRLWTTIIVLPAHPAVDVAKQLASVDQLCEGHRRTVRPPLVPYGRTGRDDEADLGR
jgi:alkanesulfonate monooxygenase SsuD/methylene tetrahydromethanopterin reductase-like flavin-dependent oxidoreductase (luciferase family)